MTDTAPALGHNNPPEPTPFELYTNALDDLMTEARAWMDGEPIDSQAKADSVGILMDTLRLTKKNADEARAAEKKPFDDGAKAVQARWRPLIDRADLAAETCKKALRPWLEAVEERQREEAEAARQEAESKAREAAEAARAAAEANDLTALEAAREKVDEAKRADAVANKAEKARPQAMGGARATALRTTYRPELTDLSAAVKHFWAQNRPAFEELVCKLAVDEVRAGKRSIPGFTVHEERAVV
jgi:hypothetical protein